MTMVEALNIVTALFDGFPNSRRSQGTEETYAGMIQEFSESAAARAVKRLVETAEYLPSVKALRAAIKAEGGHKSARECAMQGPADPHCQECVGTGWVRVDVNASEICVCRWPDGGARRGPVPNRAGFPIEVQEALTEFEFSIREPLCPDALRDVFWSMREVGAERAAERIRASIRMVRGAEIVAVAEGGK